MDPSWNNGVPQEMPIEAVKQTLIDNEDISFGEHLYLTAKRQPFLIAGVLGFATVCGVGVYKWRRRTISPQLFFIQLRVAAQGTALGCISLGMLYQLYNNLIGKKAH